MESLRSLLSHKSVNQIINIHPSAISQWVIAANDLLKDVFEFLTDWQRRATIERYLENKSSTRQVLEDRISRLENHVNILKGVVRINPSDLFGEIPKLTDVSHLLPKESEALKFWSLKIGSSTYEASFKDFKVKLGDQFPNLSNRAWDQLKASLDVEDTGFVTIHRWGSFIEGFGPDISNALNQMEETLGEDFFAGFLTSDDTVAVLNMCDPGAFLIRFSTHEPCALVIAHKTVSSVIKQNLIISQRGFFELDGQRYNSLKEIIVANKEDYKFPAPSVRSIARAKYFKGFLSKDETTRLLENQPSGTFLFRFSSEAGNLVVGYKVGEHVRQTRVFAEPQNGGYKLGQTIYPKIEDIVRLNPLRLRIPFGGVASVAAGGSESTFNGSWNQQSQFQDRYGGLTTVNEQPNDGYAPIDNLLDNDRNM